jgi:large subunit ribosomal protein L35
VPKLKTHKATAKRFKVSGAGKLLRLKGHRSHLRRKKPANARRLFSKKLPVAKTNAITLKQLMPH